MHYGNLFFKVFLCTVPLHAVKGLLDRCVGIRLSCLPGWPAGIQHWGIPEFFCMSGSRTIFHVALLETQFCKQHKKIFCMWECFTWGILGSWCAQSYWQESYISTFWAGIYCIPGKWENDKDFPWKACRCRWWLFRSIGPMLPEMKALKALHLTLKEKHINIRRYALRIIEPLSLGSCCWKRKQSCFYLQAAYQLQQAIRTLQNEARWVVRKMETHIEFLEKNIIQNRWTFVQPISGMSFCHCRCPCSKVVPALLGAEAASLAGLLDPSGLGAGELGRDGRAPWCQA